VESRRTGMVNGILALITIVALVPMSRVGNRLPMLVQDIDFGLVLALLISFPGLAWWRLVRAVRHDSVVRWRVGISVAGSIALSLSILIPVLAVLLPFFGPTGMSLLLRWDFLSIWMIVSLAAFLLGVLSVSGVRFALLMGGFAMSSFVILLPKGVL
jgi:hypothetical protein